MQSKNSYGKRPEQQGVGWGNKRDMKALADRIATVGFIIDNRNGDPITKEEAKHIGRIVNVIDEWIKYNREHKVPLPDIRREGEHSG